MIGEQRALAWQLECRYALLTSNGTLDATCSFGTTCPVVAIGVDERFVPNARDDSRDLRYALVMQDPSKG